MTETARAGALRRASQPKPLPCMLRTIPPAAGRRLRTLGCTLALLATTPAALAQWQAVSELRFDWSSLQVTPLATDGAVPVLTWQQLGSTVDAYRPSALSVADWTTPLTSQTGSAASAFSISSLDAASLLSRSEDHVADALNSSTWTSREGQFLVQGSGQVQVSIELDWQAALEPPSHDGFSHFANLYGAISAATRLDPRGNVNRHGDATFSVQKSAAFPSDVGSFEGRSTLSFTVEVLDGDLFFFVADVASVASIFSSVPEPTQAALLALGIGVIGVTARRQRATALCALSRN